MWRRSFGWCAFEERKLQSRGINALPKQISKTTTLAILALGALTITACASQPEPGGRDGGPRGERWGGSYQGGIIARPLALLLTGMDANGDYRVSGQEVAEGVEAEWANLSQGDRTVSALKHGAWAKIVLGSEEAMPNSIAFDTNLNGQITKLEFGDRLRAEYARLDKDEDGFVTRAEMVSELPAPSIQGEQSRGQDSGGRGQGGRGEGRERR